MVVAITEIGKITTGMSQDGIGKNQALSLNISGL
jgi:hypothetical protein